MAVDTLAQGSHGTIVQIPKASISKGAVVNTGAFLGVALQDTDADGLVDCDIGPAVHNLSVVGADGAGNSAVAIGDALYWDATVINKDVTNGKRLGTALDVVSSGATTTIRVLFGVAVGTVDLDVSGV